MWTIKMSNTNTFLLAWVTSLSFVAARHSGAVGTRGHPLTWTKYHDLADHQKFLFSLEMAYPNTVEVEKIGSSVLGVPLLVLKVCAGGCGARPGFWGDGGIHGREWISPAAVSYLADVSFTHTRNILAVKETLLETCPREQHAPAE